MSDNIPEKFHICAELIGPLRKDDDDLKLQQVPCTTYIVFNNNVNNSILYLETNFTNGKNLIDSLVLYYKKTGDMSIINRFIDPTIKNEQPIDQGTFMLSRLVLTDLDMEDNYYAKRVFTFLEH
jgi:hypothetical protein